MRIEFALVSKFKINFLSKAFPNRDEIELHQQIKKSEQLLSIAKIEFVWKNIIKIVKNNAFAEEMSSLSSANNRMVAKVKQNKKLYSLDPFFNEDQVLRVSDRLKNSSLNNGYIYPILLPRMVLLLRFW